MDRDLQKTMKFNIDKDSNKTPKEILLRGL